MQLLALEAARKVSRRISSYHESAAAGVSALLLAMVVAGCGSTEQSAAQATKAASSSAGTVFVENMVSTGRSTKGAEIAQLYQARVSHDVELVIAKGGHYVLAVYTGNGNRNTVIVDALLAPPDGNDDPARAAQVSALRNGTSQLIRQLLGLLPASKPVQEALKAAYREGSDPVGALGAALRRAHQAPAGQTKFVRILDDGLQRDEDMTQAGAIDMSQELAESGDDKALAAKLAARAGRARGVQVRFSGLGLTANAFVSNQSRLRDLRLISIYRRLCTAIHAARCIASAN